MHHGLNCEDCPDFLSCTEPCEKVEAALPNRRKPDREALLGDMNSFSSESAYRFVYPNTDGDATEVACRLLYRAGFSIRKISSVIGRSHYYVTQRLQDDPFFSA